MNSRTDFEDEFLCICIIKVTVLRGEPKFVHQLSETQTRIIIIINSMVVCSSSLETLDHHQAHLYVRPSSVSRGDGCHVVGGDDVGVTGGCGYPLAMHHILGNHFVM